MSNMPLGVLFSFGALFSWGFGDFFIQRTTRLIGTWKALFCIGALGAVGLFPFIQDALIALTMKDIAFLWLVTVITLFAALFNFEALKCGKITIIEPVMGMELPITVGLSILIWKEQVTLFHLLLIAITFVGITLAITNKHIYLREHRRIFEKGVILAGLGAIAMALMNFTTGIASQELSPLLTIWFVHTSLALLSGGYLAITGALQELWHDIQKYPRTIAALSVFDNIAWIFYATAMTYIPIAIATTISESYIILASLLGIIVNRERLKVHQWLGIGLTITSILLLSVTTAA